MAIDVRRVGVVGVLLIVLVWAKFYITRARVNSDATSETDMLAAKEKAQPLIEALEKYRVDNGFYPTMLDSLNGEYLSPEKLTPFRTVLSSKREGTRLFLYSAYPYDRLIIKSDACAARDKSLQGWIMEPTKEYQQQVAQFNLDCVTGYRNYELQSGDFPPDWQSYRIERWAYYESGQKQWSVGWCSYDRTRSSTAMNGVCRR
jgi:hypothetical protein